MRPPPPPMRGEVTEPIRTVGSSIPETERISIEGLPGERPTSTLLLVAAGVVLLFCTALLAYWLS